jgi:hypothetical protein
MSSESDPEPAETTEVQQSQPILPAHAAKNPALLAGLVVAGLVVAAAAAGGGYMLWHRSRPAQTQPTAAQSASAPVPVADWAVAGADSKPVPDGAAPSASANSGQAQATTSPTDTKPAAGIAASATAPQAATPASHPPPPSVAFNPKKLDPKKNARLKFDLVHFPPSLPFTVMMDGKIFFRGTAAGKAGYDGLYVPPGMHELRIEARAGAVQKESNIVRANFIAKKHMRLKVELRALKNRPAAGAASLDPAAQIVASLKTDFFSF